MHGGRTGSGAASGEFGSFADGGGGCRIWCRGLRFYLRGGRGVVGDRRSRRCIAVLLGFKRRRAGEVRCEKRSGRSGVIVECSSFGGFGVRICSFGEDEVFHQLIIVVFGVHAEGGRGHGLFVARDAH